MQKKDGVLIWEEDWEKFKDSKIWLTLKEEQHLSALNVAVKVKLRVRMKKATITITIQVSHAIQPGLTSKGKPAKHMQKIDGVLIWEEDWETFEDSKIWLTLKEEQHLSALNVAVKVKLKATITITIQVVKLK